jgi:hypothetical protein
MVQTEHRAIKANKESRDGKELEIRVTRAIKVCKANRVSKDGKAGRELEIKDTKAIKDGRGIKER